MKFNSTIGIEYTFLPPKGTDIYDLLLPLQREFNRSGIKLHSKISDDFGVIEIRSPIHKNWNSLANFYDKMCKIANKYELRAFSRNECGGGAHIHVGIPKKGTIVKKLSFIRKAFLDISQRPYLSWIFNEPEDIDNAKSFFTGKKNYITHQKVYPGMDFIKSLEGKILINLEEYNSTIAYKEYAIRFDNEYDTIEFRFFDMPRNKNELKLNVQFINNYINFIKVFPFLNAGTQENRKIRTSNDLKKFDRQNSLIEFYKLLLLLNLKPKDYKVYIKRNFEKRLQYGRKHLN